MSLPWLPGLGSDGVQLPPFDVPAGIPAWTTWYHWWERTKPLIGQIGRPVPLRLHLQFIHLPLFPFHYNLFQSSDLGTDPEEEGEGEENGSQI